MRSSIAKTLGFLGMHDRHQGFSSPWEQLDLSDPEHPRLTCIIAQLHQEDRQLKGDPAQAQK